MAIGGRVNDRAEDALALETRVGIGGGLEAQTQDLRGEGAWKAGATQAICSCSSRSDSQQWARVVLVGSPENGGVRAVCCRIAEMLLSD